MGWVSGPLWASRAGSQGRKQHKRPSSHYPAAGGSAEGNRPAAGARGVPDSPLLLPPQAAHLSNEFDKRLITVMKWTVRVNGAIGIVRVIKAVRIVGAVRIIPAPGIIWIKHTSAGISSVLSKSFWRHYR